MISNYYEKKTQQDDLLEITSGIKINGCIKINYTNKNNISKDYNITRHVLNLIQKSDLNDNLIYDLLTNITDISNNLITLDTGNGNIYLTNHKYYNLIIQDASDNTFDYYIVKYNPETYRLQEITNTNFNTNYSNIYLLSMHNICNDTSLYELTIDQTLLQTIPIFLPYLIEEVYKYQSYKINIQIESKTHINIVLISTNNYSNIITIPITPGTENVISVFSNSKSKWLI